MSENKKLVARLRDGTELNIGDEVETGFHKKCEGEIFVVSEIHPWSSCESKTLILVHLKGHPDRPLKSQFAGRVEADGSVRPPGIDANWFKPLKK